MAKKYTQPQKFMAQGDLQKRQMPVMPGPITLNSGFQCDLAVIH